MKTAIVYSERFLEHRTGEGHPERPDRLTAIVGGLKKACLWNNSNTPLLKPSPATTSDIELAHTRAHIELVREFSASKIPIDGDTPSHKKTYEIALLAAGGTVGGAKAVWAGEVNSAFALVRPPGHHATRSAGGGFCYFNNIAVALRKLQAEGLKRALVLDFDAHHGNGTQDIFYDDPGVLYISLHQWPLYPGTGRPEEIGEGEGLGFTANIPMAPGSGDPEYRCALEEIFEPLAEQFRPELIAVSAGFDSHFRDPLASLQLTSEFYGWMMEMVRKTAERLCRGKVFVVLEGGYDLFALEESATNVVRALQGEEFPLPERSETVNTVKMLKKSLGDFWKF